MTSFIRVLHASPNAPAVDVLANETVIASNVSYREFTEYLSVPAGTYRVRVFPAGTRNTPVIDTTLEIPGGVILTVAAVGRLAEISLLPIEDRRIAVPRNQVLVRAAHLSPDAPNVDVTLADGTVLFSNVAFQEVTDYLPLSPGTFTLQIRVAGTDTIVLTAPNQTLSANRLYTVYVVGLVTDAPGLQILTALDGSSYLPV